jgi:hypothetical protein
MMHIYIIERWTGNWWELHSAFRKFRDAYEFCSGHDHLRYTKIEVTEPKTR